MRPRSACEVAHRRPGHLAEHLEHRLGACRRSGRRDVRRVVGEPEQGGPLGAQPAIRVSRSRVSWSPPRGAAGRRGLVQPPADVAVAQRRDRGLDGRQDQREQVPSLPADSARRCAAASTASSESPSSSARSVEVHGEVVGLGEHPLAELGGERGDLAR